MSCVNWARQYFDALPVMLNALIVTLKVLLVAAYLALQLESLLKLTHEEGRQLRDLVDDLCSRI